MRVSVVTYGCQRSRTSGFRSLGTGTRLKTGFQALSNIRRCSDVPILFICIKSRWVPGFLRTGIRPGSSFPGTGTRLKIGFQALSSVRRFSDVSILFICIKSWRVPGFLGTGTRSGSAFPGTGTRLGSAFLGTGTRLSSAFLGTGTRSRSQIRERAPYFNKGNSEFSLHICFQGGEVAYTSFFTTQSMYVARAN